MHLDVQDLRNFYYHSTLGRAVQRSIRSHVVKLWPDTTGQTVAGFGFAVPFLRPFLARSRRVVALMPAQQGVMPWPAGQPNISLLTDERHWPLETGHVDRLIVAHGLETTNSVPSLMAEVSRVLGPGGRVMFIVPNRASLWSRSDLTPMGFGHPYTAGQLENLLRLHGLSPERQVATLFQPPSHLRFWIKSGPMLDRFGQYLPLIAGGVQLVEASKRYPPPQGTRIPSQIEQG